MKKASESRIPRHDRNYGGIQDSVKPNRSTWYKLPEQGEMPQQGEILEQGEN